MRIVAEGSHRTVAWVPDESGRYRGEDFFNELGEKDRAKMMALFERASEGDIRNKEKFRMEQDGIFCFKSFQLRFLCFMDGPRLCITNGLRKKQDRLPPQELDRAKRIRSVYHSAH